MSLSIPHRLIHLETCHNYMNDSILIEIDSFSDSWKNYLCDFLIREVNVLPGNIIMIVIFSLRDSVLY